MIGVLRRKVDVLDDEIVGLLQQRLLLVEELGRLKADIGMPVCDPEREAQILARLALHAQEKNLDQEMLVDIYSAIFKTSREVQEKLIYTD